ncbi:HNH endonuclease [Pectobacterium phage phiTE]|uniref:HNH endonuclease n=2 Tax=root TaxID=1 RepID=K9L581_9CAUD|nr:HNH endonuclease [Pectobacterium phage phiTE]AEZ66360.1 HNH endonuclease [Pectobacterium phage phiTE]
MYPSAEIKGFPGYMVDWSGKVWSVDRTIFRSDTGTPVFQKGTVLKTTRDRLGYLNVGLSLGKGKSKRKRVHRLVAENLIPNPRGLPQVNHKDGDKSNPCGDNLEWTDNSGNVQHAVDTGLLIHERGVKANRFEATTFAINIDSGEIVSIMRGNQEMKESGFDYRLVSAVFHGKRRSHRGCVFFKI